MPPRGLIGSSAKQAMRWRGGRTSGIVEDRRGAPYGPASTQDYANAEEDELDPRIMDLIARNPRLREALPDFWSPMNRTTARATRTPQTVR